MAKAQSNRVRVNITMDRELLGHLDELVKSGAIGHGRRVFRERSGALEYIVADWLEQRELVLSDMSSHGLMRAGHLTHPQEP
jgi:metal-responsive CopG/Arc/MetJ family transcriptional regulator